MRLSATAVCNGCLRRVFRNHNDYTVQDGFFFFVLIPSSPPATSAVTLLFQSDKEILALECSSILRYDGKKVFFQSK